MTVKELKKALRKLPDDLVIYGADHDHGKYETNGKLGDIELIDKSEMDDIENDEQSYYGKPDSCYQGTPDIYVVFRNI